MYIYIYIPTYIHIYIYIYIPLKPLFFAAIVACVYSMYTFFWRRKRIRRKDDRGIDDPCESCHTQALQVLQCVAGVAVCCSAFDARMIAASTIHVSHVTHMDESCSADK